MKRGKKLLACLLAMAFLRAPWYGLEAKAAEETLVSGDFQYEVDEDGSSVSVIKYQGGDGVVEIPAEIDGKKVTSIGGYESRKVTLSPHLFADGEKLDC